MRRIKKLARKALRRVDDQIGAMARTVNVSVPFRIEHVVDTARDPKKLRKAVLGRLPGVVAVGRRGSLKRSDLGTVPRITKQFTADADGDRALNNEKEARRRFGDRPWMLSIVEEKPHAIVMPALPAESLLSNVAPGLSADERRDVACACIEIAFDLFCAGYAHRDFHAGNIFLVDGQLVLIDFETLEPYPDPRSVPFPAAYDLVGRGLPSPHKTDNMCYAHAFPQSLQSVLRVSLEEALDLFRVRLKDELRESSRSFKGIARDDRGRARRHQCKTDRIYGSFALPHLVVRGEEAQRDSGKRFARFGITEEVLRGRTLLDLGSNVGGMTFNAQAFGPKSSLGVEFDDEKVAIATRVARFNGLKDVAFQQGNLDLLNGADLPISDVVFCLAIEAHVQDPAHLYRLLGEATDSTLFFEGNAGCDLDAVEEALRAGGFARFDRRGLCDDDSRPENNNRPLLVAHKRA